MNCRRVSSLISAYIDGELTGVEMFEIRRHVDDCRACTLQYESLRHTKQLLSRLAYAEPRAGLADSICARLECIETPRYQRMWHRIWEYGQIHLSPVAAGCLALAAVLMLLMSHSVTKHDIVAQPRTLIFAGATSLPLSATISTPAGFFTLRSEAPHPLIPSPASDQMPGADSFIPVRFEGR